MALFKLGGKPIKSAYGTDSKTLKISNLNKQMVDFLLIVAGDNIIKSTRSYVIVDVSSIKDVETALNMINVVSEVKRRVQYVICSVVKNENSSG